MIAVIFVIVGMIAFFLRIYSNWNYKQKFTFKSVCIYISLGVLLLMICSAFYTVGLVYENEQDRMLPSRLSSIRYTADRGEYMWLAEYMDYDKDYEPEFEYLWERLEMHDCCYAYLIYHTAAGRFPDNQKFAEQEQKYREKLISLCNSPCYQENAPYGEYFLNRAGLS
jgi:hypothetical protein